MTGDLPERISVGREVKKATPTPTTSDVPDSSSASPDAQAAATAATSAPASEPGKPAGKEKGAKARVVELDADIAALQQKLAIRAQLREELARVEPRTSQPGSDPAKAPTQTEYERILAMPGAPKEEDFDSYAKFSAAQALFIADTRWQEHETRQAQSREIDQTVQSVRQISEAAQTRVTEFAKSDPDFASKVNPQLLNLDTATMRRVRGEQVGPQHVLAEELAKSEHVAPLLIHFSTPDGQKEWADLMRRPPTDLLRAFGRIEARFDREATSAPAPKQVSDAPDPGTVLGSRASASVDPVAGALGDKDFSRYAREATKRELAALGG